MAREVAQAKYDDRAKEPDASTSQEAAQLEAAKAAYQRARATLERALTGASPEEVAAQETAVKQGELALKAAQDRTADTQLLAPFAGVILEVNARVEENVGSLQPVVLLADLSQMQIEVEVEEVDAPARPGNTYGATKLAVDMMITGECLATGLGAVSLRYFNVAGAALGAGERHAIETHLIPNALGAVAGTKDPLTVFGDDWPTPDGTPVRDYVHVLDLARAHVLALGAARSGEHLICNLGSGDGYSVKEVLTAVEQVTGRPVPHSVGPRRAGDPTRLIASNARARERLGWAPQLGLTDMVQDAWAFTTTGRTIR